MKKSEWIKAVSVDLVKKLGLPEIEATNAALLAVNVLPEVPWEPERVVVPEAGWVWIAKDPTIAGDKRAFTEHEARRGSEILNGFETARELMGSALNGGGMSILAVREQLRAFFQIEEGGA